MIYCPSCGTANKSGSKFCNQCGHNLTGVSKAACPACGAANPTENLFCDSCGAKLAPLVTKGSEERAEIKGLSLPTKPLDEEGQGPLDGEEMPAAQEEEASVPEDTAKEDAGLPEEGEAEEEMPEWLLRLRAASPASGEQPEESAPSETPSPEDWGEFPSEDLEEADVPEWLQQLEPAEPMPPQEEPSAPEVEEGEEALLSDVWAEEANRDQLAAEPAEPEAPAPAEEEPPALKPTEELPQQAEEAPGGIPALAQPPSDEEDLAAWLQAEGPVILEPDEGEEEEEDIVFEPRAGETEEAPDQGRLPSWIETLAPEGVLPEELGGEFVEEGRRTPEAMGLERAEIPSWLEGLRPGRPGEQMPEAEETVEESGVLQGVVGALRLVQDIDPLPSSQMRPMSEPVAATPAQANLFADLLSRPTSSVVKPRPVSAAPKRERGFAWLATLLLIAAVLLPFFATGLVPGGDTVAVPQPVSDLAERIRDLNETDVVLVSFDYDPGVSTELDWPAEVILEDLEARSVNLLVMGVTPTGPGLAARFDIPAGEALFLGYLPGQEMGLQRLASNLEGIFTVDFFSNAVSDAPFGVKSLNDVALVLTIAASQETVRWWMEQVGTQTGAPPIGAIVSAAIEPAVRPYYASGQIVGLVSGWVGAQAYEEAAGLPASEGEGGPAALEAQSLAHLAIAGLILLGNAVYWGKRLFGRRA